MDILENGEDGVFRILLQALHAFLNGALVCQHSKRQAKQR